MVWFKYFVKQLPQCFSQYVSSHMKVKVTQLRLTLCDPMDYALHGILQARILQWVAFPFSRESFQPRDRIQVSLIVGEFFTSRNTKEAQEYWSGQAIHSPVDLPYPVINLGSPALQVDSLPAELSGKPILSTREAHLLTQLQEKVKEKRIQEKKLSL